MKINIEKVPFSRRGAYLAISKDPGHLGGGVWLRSLIRPEWGTGRKKVSDHLFRFIPFTADGIFIDYEIECLPWEMKLKSSFGSISCYFTSEDSLIIESDRIGMVIEHDHDELAAVNRIVKSESFKAYFPIIHYNAEIKALCGSIKYDRALKRIYISPLDGKTVLCIKACRKDMDTVESTDTAYGEEYIGKIRRDYESFISNYSIDNEHSELAAYILWSTEYSIKGNIVRRCNGISKSLMNLVWSWDNCFNALAVAGADAKLAWDNIFLFFDLQREDGMLPDAVNPAIVVDWFTKPPVHGFTIRKLLEQGYALSAEDKKTLYHCLTKWTDWWYGQLTNEGLVKYRHPFDSGWDNATFFDYGYPIASPDLNAYLVIQQDVLAQLAKELGFAEEAQAWTTRADLLLNNMIDKMWNGNKFVCINDSGEIIPTNSLIRIMPVVLGKRLPEHIMKILIDELSVENHFLTYRGVATESVRSQSYDHRKGDPAKPNAYWRGPIWPPVVYLIVCGLREAGEFDLAAVISHRYICTVEANQGAMFENYDALTGEGYDDSSYTWTSAVYLLFKNH